MGARVRAAREAAAITQAELSQALGFSDRQTLSAIEMGDRRVQATELVQLSEILARNVEWFIDPFVIAGEARFSWRVSHGVSDQTLDDFESRIGQVVGLLRHLKVVLHGPSKALTPMLRMPPYPTFEDAWSWGESVVDELELGVIPSLTLVDRIEAKLDLSVLLVDAEIDARCEGISGAMCRLPDLGVIVVNRRESAVRRHFNVAHELFHALTWDAMPPDRREDPDKDPGKRLKRIEQLAENFAASVLMPKSSLLRLISSDRFGDAPYLADVARELQVSASALAFRLFNAKMIDKPTCDVLRTMRTTDAPTDVPRLFSASFVSLLHDGVAQGHVSARKAAKALSVTLNELASLMSDHGKTVPFSL